MKGQNFLDIRFIEDKTTKDFEMTLFLRLFLKKQKTKCIDQYNQTSSIEFLIFPNSIDDEKKVFH